MKKFVGFIVIITFIIFIIVIFPRVYAQTTFLQAGGLRVIQLVCGNNTNCSKDATDKCLPILKIADRGGNPEWFECLEKASAVTPPADSQVATRSTPSPGTTSGGTAGGVHPTQSPSSTTQPGSTTSTGSTQTGGQTSSQTEGQAQTPAVCAGSSCFVIAACNQANANKVCNTAFGQGSFCNPRTEGVNSGCFGGTTPGGNIPLDSDGDGIPNNLDKCPLQPEDFDGVADTDGCIDLPNATPSSGTNQGSTQGPTPTPRPTAISTTRPTTSPRPTSLSSPRSTSSPRPSGSAEPDKVGKTDSQGKKTPASNTSKDGKTLKSGPAKTTSPQTCSQRSITKVFINNIETRQTQVSVDASGQPTQIPIKVEFSCGNSYVNALSFVYKPSAPPQDPGTGLPPPENPVGPLDCRQKGAAAGMTGSDYCARVKYVDPSWDCVLPYEWVGQTQADAEGCFNTNLVSPPPGSIVGVDPITGGLTPVPTPPPVNLCNLADGDTEYNSLEQCAGCGAATYACDYDLSQRTGIVAATYPGPCHNSPWCQSVVCDTPDDFSIPLTCAGCGTQWFACAADQSKTNIFNAYAGQCNSSQLCGYPLPQVCTTNNDFTLFSGCAGCGMAWWSCPADPGRGQVIDADYPWETRCQTPQFCGGGGVPYFGGGFVPGPAVGGSQCPYGCQYYAGHGCYQPPRTADLNTYSCPYDGYWYFDPIDQQCWSQCF